MSSLIYHTAFLEMYSFLSNLQIYIFTKIFLNIML